MHYQTAKAFYFLERMERLSLAILVSFLCLCLASVLHQVEKSTISRVLRAAGYYSMSIFLLHTLFESFIRIVFYQLILSGNTKFEPIAVIAVGSGIVFPLLMEKFLLRKRALTRRYIFGP